MTDKASDYQTVAIRGRRILLVLAMAVAGCEKRSSPPVAGAKPNTAAWNAFTFPANYDGKEELPVLVTLHGMGSKPTGFLGDDFQDIADELRVAVVAVRGPEPLEHGGFAWSDDLTENFLRVTQALGEAAVTAKLRKDRVVLVGYSQGAYAALGLAYAHPEVFGGAIAISPGSRTNPPLPAVNSPLLPKRGFVLCYGSKDEAEFIRQGKERLEAARRAGAKVETKVYPEHEHLIPPDLDELLPKWFAFVVRANEG